MSDPPPPHHTQTPPPTHTHTHTHSLKWTNTHAQTKNDTHTHTSTNALFCGTFTNLSIWLPHPQNGDSCVCHSLRSHSLAVFSPCPCSPRRPSRCCHYPDQTYKTASPLQPVPILRTCTLIDHPHLPHKLIGKLRWREGGGVKGVGRREGGGARDAGWKREWIITSQRLL